MADGEAVCSGSAKMFANPILPISKAESKHELLNPIMIVRRSYERDNKSLTFRSSGIPPATIKKLQATTDSQRRRHQSPYPLSIETELIFAVESKRVIHAERTDDCENRGGSQYRTLEKRIRPFLMSGIKRPLWSLLTTTSILNRLTITAMKVTPFMRKHQPALTRAITTPAKAGPTILPRFMTVEFSNCIKNYITTHHSLTAKDCLANVGT